MNKTVLIVLVLCLCGFYLIPRQCNVYYQAENFSRRIFTPSNKLVHSAKGNVSYDELDENVFKRLGFRIKDASVPVPTLEFIQEQTCDQIFYEWNFGVKRTPEVPPKELPYYKRDEYTMYGYAHLVMDYRNEKLTSRNVKWDNIEEQVKKENDNYVKYGTDGKSVLYAMQAFPPKDLTGIIIGSLEPWVEIFALRTGAKKLVTVEYANLEITNTDRVTFLKATDLAKNYKEYVGKFDFAASYSSVEHSGLGRFGDPMDPIGDLREMSKIKCLLKKGGLLYFGVPRGQDTVFFNLHRIYGRIRLAMMFTGFEWVGTFRGSVHGKVDMTSEDLDERSHLITTTQDTFVLRKI